VRIISIKDKLCKFIIFNGMLFFIIILIYILGILGILGIFSSFH